MRDRECYACSLAGGAGRGVSHEEPRCPGSGKAARIPDVQPVPAVGLRKQEYHARYHDSVTEVYPGFTAELFKHQAQQLLVDLVRVPALPTDGRDIVLRLRQEHVKPGHRSKLAPEMKWSFDHQIISEMDVTWEAE